MKKMFAIVLALMLCVSILSVASFAAEGDMVVHIQAPEAWEKCYAYNWPEALGGWPGTELSADADGLYTLTLSGSFDGMVIGAGDGQPQTVDITDLDLTAGEAWIVIGEAGADGKHTYTVTYREDPPPPPPEKEYYVAGVASLCGVEWDPAALANKMTYVDGIYTITYKNVAPGQYSFKITDGTWDNSWGGNGENDNFEFEVTRTCDVSIEFTPIPGRIFVDILLPPPPQKDYYVAGVAELCGVEWDPDVEANKMTYADGVYTITYKNVAPGHYSFLITDGTWDLCWGGCGENGNFDFEVTETTDVTIEFNPITETVSVICGKPKPGDVSLAGVSMALLVATAGLVLVVSKKKAF
ncbi:MAG: starch-binding protein [Ruminococcaceae bacterium]|nr:starch-binding protein [Oscillospiraceae bacterium]